MIDQLTDTTKRDARPTDFDLADSISDQVIEWKRTRSRFDIDLLVRSVPDEESYPESAAAAMAAALSELRGSGADLNEAERQLRDRYPSWSSSISEALMLERALISASAVSGAVRNVPEYELPYLCGPWLQATRSPRYRLESFAGAGSFGRVYRAVDLAMTSEDRPAYVAIKFTAPDAAQRAYSELEAIKARRVEHPNVVRVLDHGVEGESECRYTVFEWVEGEDLHEWTAVNRTRIEVLELVSELAIAVDAMHRAGVVHCDIKPSNVLVDANGRVRVTDVGLSRVVSDISPLSEGVKHRYRASWGFMSPEQALADVFPKATSDIYSIGALLHWLLTDRLVFEGTPIEIESWHREQREHASPPSLPLLSSARIRAIIQRCMHPDPNERYTSARDLSEDLIRVRGGLPVPWLDTSPTRRLGLLVRRRPAIAFLSFAVLGSTVFGGVALNDAAIQNARVEAQEKVKTDVSTRLQALAEIERTGSELPERVMLVHHLMDRMYELGLLDAMMHEDWMPTERIAYVERLRSEFPDGTVENAWYGVVSALLLTNDGQHGAAISMTDQLLGYLEATTGQHDPLTVQARVVRESASLARMHSGDPKLTDEQISAERKAVADRLRGLVSQLPEVHRRGAIGRLAERELTRHSDR